MKHEVIRIPGVKTVGLPFSHVVKAGDILYLTSQISCDLQTGLVIPGTWGSVKGSARCTTSSAYSASISLCGRKASSLSR